MSDTTYYIQLAVQMGNGPILVSSPPVVLDFEPMGRIATLESAVAHNANQCDRHHENARRLTDQLVKMREELMKRDAQIEEMGELIDRQSNEIDEMRPVYEVVGSICADDLRNEPWNALRMVVETYIKGG